MKKSHLILLVLLVANISLTKAQGLFPETGMYDNNDYWIRDGYNSYFYSEGLWETNTKATKKILAKSGIKAYEHKGFKIKKGKKADKPSFVRIAKFDDNYNLIENIYNNKQILFKYNKNNCFTDYKLIKNGKLIKHEIVEYNDSCRVLKYEYYKKNDTKLKRKWVAEYDKSQNKKLSETHYSKDGVTEKSRWEYYYYENGKHKQTKYYKKGELKHIWNYTCDDEGKEQKKDVETTQVCKIKEYLEDSSYVIVNRSTDNKGRITKNVTKYNKDGKILEARTYNYKGKILWGNDYRYNCKGQKIQSITYKRGGLIWLKEEWFYNNDLTVKYKYYGRKGKLKHSVEYKYNTDKQLIERAEYDKRQNLIRKYKYEYNDKGNIVKTTVYNKKDQPTYVYETKFIYKK